MEYRRDRAAGLVEDQYLLGPDLLAAPVLKEGQTSREVYFPKGAAWIDWWTGKRHEGGATAKVAAPLDRLPLFIRAGAIVPVSAVTQHTGEMRDAPLTLLVARGADGSGRVFQDAGDGYGYLQGQSRTISARQQGQSLRLEISENRGYQRVSAIEFIGLRARPPAVRIDGQEVEGAFDAATRRLRVALPGEHVKQVLLAD